MFAATVISPLELIRTKMQSESLTYKDIGRAVHSTVSQGGPFSLMRGLGPTLLRDVPFSGEFEQGSHLLPNDGSDVCVPCGIFSQVTYIWLIPAAVYWFGYEFLKAKQMSRRGTEVPKFYECLLAGAVSGTVSRRF